MQIKDKIVRKSVESLKFYEKNNRYHSESQIELLAKNIKKFGFTVPVLIDKHDILVAGHGRVLACKRLGIKEVPCIVLDDLTEDEIKAIRITDNRISDLSDIDWQNLKMEFDELKDSDFDIELLGFDDRDLCSIFYDKSDKDFDLSIERGNKDSNFEKREIIVFKDNLEEFDYLLNKIKNDERDINIIRGLRYVLNL